MKSTFNAETLQRPNIQALKPYSCARNDFKGKASVYLDANENPNNTPFNRYPDPLQWTVKQRIEEIKHISATQIFLGVGSDEPIDLLYRAFCEPKEDNVVAMEPTYGMYRVCADINNVEYRPVRLNEEFQLSAEQILQACDGQTKLIWLCSPNNPTGNDMDITETGKILRTFDGIVVIDEAYIDFAERNSWTQRLQEFANLVVLQTFSKAWGSAAIRLGMAFASETVIDILNKIKYPYNINILTQRQALTMLDNEPHVAQWVQEILTERKRMQVELLQCDCVLQLYPTQANFILAKVTDANAIYRYLIERGVVVRNRNSVSLCENCLRITIGTRAENDVLLQKLNDFSV